MEPTKNYKPFDLVYGSQSSLMLILTDEMEIPYYHDGCGSQFSKTPLDIQNPNEWKDTFSAFIGYDLSADKHIIIPKSRIRGKYDGDSQEGYIPFDNGTAKLRLNLGLVQLAEKWWGKKVLD